MPRTHLLKDRLQIGFFFFNTAIVASKRDEIKWYEY